MMTRPPNQRDRPSATPGADSGLRCPQCEYNLTGLTENRCPECGEAFDLEELRRVFGVQPEPIAGWDDRGTTSMLIAFFRVCRMTWFHPATFARHFPWAFDLASAVRFGAIARVAAIAPVVAFRLLGLCVTAKPLSRALVELIFSSVLFALGVALASLCCEAILASILSFLVTPRRLMPPAHWSSKASTSWWGLVGFHSGFLIVSGMGVAVVGVLLPGMTGGKMMPWPVWGAALAASVCWWWYSLSIGIRVRTRPGPGRTVALLLIPVVAAAAIGAGPVLCVVRL